MPIPKISEELVTALKEEIYRDGVFFLLNWHAEFKNNNTVLVSQISQWIENARMDIEEGKDVEASILLPLIYCTTLIERQINANELSKEFRS